MGGMQVVPGWAFFIFSGQFRSARFFMLHFLRVIFQLLMPLHALSLEGLNSSSAPLLHSIYARYVEGFIVVYRNFIKNYYDTKLISATIIIFPLEFNPDAYYQHLLVVT
jgi:hypothetical protein